jgi:hypothetical protein
MKRTAEELIALRAKREGDDKQKLREERRRAAGRAKRRRLGDGDLVRELGLTTEELRGLVLEAKQPGTRARWARLGGARGVRAPVEAVEQELSAAAE